jgi:hypothetical protein
VQREGAAVGKTAHGAVKNAAGVFVIAQRLQKRAALIEAAVAALHAVALNGGRHLAHLHENVGQIMAHRPFAQSFKVRNKL